MVQFPKLADNFKGAKTTNSCQIDAIDFIVKTDLELVFFMAPGYSRF